jgi:hypothetical protein
MSVELAAEEVGAAAADEVVGSVEAAATAETEDDDEPESEAEPVAKAAPAARLVEVASEGTTAAAKETSAEGGPTTALAADAAALGAAPPPLGLESDEAFHDPCPPLVDHFSEASELTRVELVMLVELLCLLPRREQDELVGLPRAEGARAMRGTRAKRNFMMNRESGRVWVGSCSGREGLLGATEMGQGKRGFVSERGSVSSKYRSW